MGDIKTLEQLFYYIVIYCLDTISIKDGRVKFSNFRKGTSASFPLAQKLLEKVPEDGYRMTTPYTKQKIKILGDLFKEIEKHFDDNGNLHYLKYHQIKVRIAKKWTK